MYLRVLREETMDVIVNLLLSCRLRSKHEEKQLRNSEKTNYTIEILISYFDRRTIHNYGELTMHIR